MSIFLQLLLAQMLPYPPPSLLSKVAVHYSEVFEHAVSVMWS